MLITIFPYLSRQARYIEYVGKPVGDSQGTNYTTTARLTSHEK